MYKIDNDTALTGALPAPTAPGPNPNGYYTAGNPGTGTPATIVDAEWLNMVQEEVSNAILGAGIALDKANRSQLFAAIKALIAGATANYVADTGAANIYVITPASGPAAYTGGETFKFIPAHTNTGASTLNRNGLGAIAIVHPDGSAVAKGDIPAGGLVEVTYQATLAKYVLLTTSTTLYSAANPGFFRVPGTPFLIQWCAYSLSPNQGTNQPAGAGTVWGVQSVSFPLTFSSALACWANPRLTNNNNYVFSAIGAFSTSGADVYATCYDNVAVGQPQGGTVVAIGTI